MATYRTKKLQRETKKKKDYLKANKSRIAEGDKNTPTYAQLISTSKSKFGRRVGELIRGKKTYLKKDSELVTKFKEAVRSLRRRKNQARKNQGIKEKSPETNIQKEQRTRF